MTDPSPARPRVVIVGSGFAGLNCAKALAHAPVAITMVDRRNHHLFQPLLYQVATAALSPANIAAPVRGVLAHQSNVEVILATAERVDTAARVLKLADGELRYDYLVLASGATHSYFGHDEWAKFAPGLKTIEDALEIRARFLVSFEAAERESDPAARRAQLTFVVVGGGPTGVEMAGSMAEIARKALPSDFRRIDTATARILLIEADDRLLGRYPRDLSEHARRDLEELGVEVRLGARVTHIDAQGVRIGDERIDAENVIWAAGVAASPVGATLGVPVTRTGQVIVGPDLSIPGHPEVFVLGDLATVQRDSGAPVPGIAPAAIQMGHYAGRLIAGEVAGRRGHRPPFRYLDKGELATIGRAKAVGLIFGAHVSGFLAWATWAGVHITYLVGFRNRLLVMLEWAWLYVAFRRGARLITGSRRVDLRRSRQGAP